VCACGTSRAAQPSRRSLGIEVLGGVTTKLTDAEYGTCDRESRVAPVGATDGS